MKILHLSFHTGCQNDIQYVCNNLNNDIELTFMRFDDGETKDNEIYNVTHSRAEKAWNKYKDYYNTFDTIITSDTAPISRVFLQNNWNKKLIIWICNRFDYSHGTGSGFPDQEYYDLIRSAKDRENVHIIGYTAFENYYAKHIRNVDIGEEVITPIGKISDVYKNFTSTKLEDKENTLFVGPYHNDNIMINLHKILINLGLKVYNGRYNGPLDLAEFKGVVHIPYAWSNLALFEALQLGIQYYIPSIEFLDELIKDKDFFWSPPFRRDVLHLSEWYNDINKKYIVYFDSWDDLIHKIKESKQMEKYNIINIEKWKKLILLK